MTKKSTNLTLLENSEKIEQKLLEWKKYRDETGIEIDFEDYQLIMLTEGEYREMESKFKKALEYGASALLTASPLGIILAYIYRKYTDRCIQKCKENDDPNMKICKYKCYINACDAAIDRYKKVTEKKKKELDDKDKIKKAEKNIQKKIDKWQKKKENYQKKLKKAQEK